MIKKLILPLALTQMIGCAYSEPESIAGSAIKKITPPNYTEYKKGKVIEERSSWQGYKIFVLENKAVYEIILEQEDKNDKERVRELEEKVKIDTQVAFPTKKMEKGNNSPVTMDLFEQHCSAQERYVGFMKPEDLKVEE